MIDPFVMMMSGTTYKNNQHLDFERMGKNLVVIRVRNSQANSIPVLKTYQWRDLSGVISAKIDPGMC
jgi:hypothetical protein